MSGSQTSLMISLIMVGLFSIAIFGFAIGFANDNNAAIDASRDARLTEDYSSLTENISNIKSSANATYKSIISTTIGEDRDVAPSVGAFGGGVSDVKNIGRTVVTAPYKIIFGGDTGGFGIFFTVFGAVILTLIGLYLYKTLRGNP